MRVRIADGLDDENSIVGLCRLLNTDKGMLDDFVIDFNKVTFMHVGLIGALAMYAKKASRVRCVHLDHHENIPCYQYLQRVNFYRAIGVFTEEGFSRHDSAGEFLEITNIIDDEDYTANDIPSRLREIISRASYVDISTISAIDQSFGEILDNVLNHSRTTVPGIAIAQHYPQKGFVEFCVVDAGIGIVQSLRENESYRDCDSKTIMESAFRYGVGENVFGVRGGNEGYGCGYGLAFTAKLVQVTGGSLWTVSQDECIVINKLGIEHVKGCWFPGTVVCARIPDRATVTEKDLDVAGQGLLDRPYYWDAQGNDIEDLFDGDGILW